MMYVNINTMASVDLKREIVRYKWESRCVASFNKIDVLLSEEFHMFVYLFIFLTAQECGKIEVYLPQ